jgi:hypothetical protein
MATFATFSRPTARFGCDSARRQERIEKNRKNVGSAPSRVRRCTCLNTHSIPHSTTKPHTLTLRQQNLNNEPHFLLPTPLVPTSHSHLFPLLTATCTHFSQPRVLTSFKNTTEGAILTQSWFPKNDVRLSKYFHNCPGAKT